MKKFTAPKAIAPVTGTILSCETIVGTNGEFIALKVQSKDRATHNFNVSPSFVEQFGLGHSLFVGNIVVIEAEECIKGVTGYIDQDGYEEPHAFDHVAVTGITPLIDQFLIEDGYAELVINRVLAKRDEIAAANASTTPKRAPRERSNEERIARLLVQYDAVTNPDTKANLALRINELGGKVPTEGKAKAGK